MSTGPWREFAKGSHLAFARKFRQQLTLRFDLWSADKEIAQKCVFITEHESETFGETSFSYKLPYVISHVIKLILDSEVQSS